MVEPLRDRVLGRIVAEDVFLPGNDEDPFVTRNSCSTKPGCRSSKTPACRRSRCVPPSPANRRSGVARIATDATWAVATRSTTRGRGRGRRAVDRRTGTQLTMRTFHIGGAASRAAAIDNVTVKTTGSVKFNNLKHVSHANGHLVAVSRSGELSVLDGHGRERERYKLPYGHDDHGQGRRRHQGWPDRGDVGHP